MGDRNNLEVGNKLELLPLEQKDDKDAKSFLSKIETFHKNKDIEILMPVDEGKLVPLAMDTKYIASFYTKAGVLQAECIIVNRYRSRIETKAFLVIRLQSELIKTQRREFFRLECEKDVFVRIISEEEIALRNKVRNYRFPSVREKEQCVNEILDLQEKAEWLPARMLDISGGGIHVKMKKQDHFTESLMFRVGLSADEVSSTSEHAIDLESTLVFAEMLEKEPDMMSVRCQFTCITNQKQEMLVKYIFDQQRKQKKRI